MFVFAADHGDVLIDIVKYISGRVRRLKRMVTALCDEPRNVRENRYGHCC